MVLLISIAAASAAPMSDGAFVDFLNAYPKMPPAQVIADLESMSEAQLAILTRRQALGASVYARACQDGATDITFPAADGPMACPELLEIQAQDIQWGMDVGAVRYAETQRLQAISALSCTLGWLDRVACAEVAKD